MTLALVAILRVSVSRFAHVTHGPVSHALQEGHHAGPVLSCPKLEHFNFLHCIADFQVLNRLAASMPAPTATKKNARRAGRSGKTTRHTEHKTSALIFIEKLKFEAKPACSCCFWPLPYVAVRSDSSRNAPVAVTNTMLPNISRCRQQKHGIIWILSATVRGRVASSNAKRTIPFPPPPPPFLSTQTHKHSHTNIQDTHLGADENLSVFRRQRFESRFHLVGTQDERVGLRLNIAEAQGLRNKALRATGLDIIDDGLRHKRNTRKTPVTQSGARRGKTVRP